MTFGSKSKIELTTKENQENGITNFLDQNKFPTREIWNDNTSDNDLEELLYEIKDLSDEDKIAFAKSITFVSCEEFKEKFMKYIPKIKDEDKINKSIIKEEQLKNRIEIELPGNGKLISEFSDELVKIIKEKDELFIRDDIKEIVEITNLGFSIVKPARFITFAEKYFEPWTKIFLKSGSTMKISKSMNQQTAGVVLVSPNFQDNIKSIKRIFTVPMPIIYNNLLTFPNKGYDHRFSSWLDYDTPKINKEMSLDKAKEIFNFIYNEFCFQEEQDKVVAIAGLITPFLRGLYSNFNVCSPMFCYLGNRERAGKDYCANITGLVLEGIKLEEPPISSGEYNSSGSNEELRKKLMSALMAGKKRLHFANNKGRLNNAVLEAFITATTHSDRILGKNKTPNFENEIDISMSGNVGMTFTGDLLNRSRFINLFLDIENANDRDFTTPNLHKWVLDNRNDIISAIYSLIKNWFDNKMPKGSIKFASFPEWAEICGGIMECAGIGNPCKQDKINALNIGLDKETDEMKQLFEILFEKFPDEWIGKQEIKDTIIESDENLFPYTDWSNRSHQTKFALKFENFVGRIMSDIKLWSDENVRASRRKYKFSLMKL